MAAQQRSDALLAWINACLDSQDQIGALSDLADGAALCSVLETIDSSYFASLSSSQVSGKNWVLSAFQLKQIYTSVTSYFSDILHLDTTSLSTPNINAIAKSQSNDDLIILISEIITLAVLSDNKANQIETIQQLDKEQQAELMQVIEETKRCLPELDESSTDGSKSKAAKHTALKKKHDTLLKTHSQLQQDHQTAIDELSSVITSKALSLPASEERRDRNEASLRDEIDRLTSELSKTEETLTQAENTISSQSKQVDELSKQVSDLEQKAATADSLKDQVDELKHAADKVSKMENVIEKYKAKLEQSADLKRQMKTLEEQNLDLLEKNNTLETEHAGSANFKPLLEEYKQQVSTLEKTIGEHNKAKDILQLELDQAKTRIQSLEADKEKDNEALRNFEERVKEMEETSIPRSSSAKKVTFSDPPSSDDELEGLSMELSDATLGSTTSSLKLQIRKLQRDLVAAKANKADASRLLVLENLLEDANAMKGRYEQQYLESHRANLLMEAQLKAVESSTKSSDAPQVAIALRQRLNETVEELDKTKRLLAEASVKLTSTEQALTIAKSDLTLVGKDQTDIIASLRASIAKEKDLLEAECTRLKGEVQLHEITIKMHSSQINALLMDKIDLQSEGIERREMMLARERDFSTLKTSLSSKADQKALASLKDQSQTQTDTITDLQEKLAKARNFIKKQDKMFRDEHAAALSTASMHGSNKVFEIDSQLQVLKAELEAEQKRNLAIEKRYQREQQLMLSGWQELGMKSVRELILSGPPPGKTTSWTENRRAGVMSGIR